MSWTDKGALKTIWAIKDFFKVRTLVETGTFKGINAEIHANHFDEVQTSELIPEYYEEAKRRLDKYDNVKLFNVDSQKHILDFIKEYKQQNRKDYVIFYLDAHFYNPDGPRWVVQRELDALKGFDKAIVIIHDFNNGLGHCIYDGERLGWNVVKNIKKINNKFKYYTNLLEHCDIVKLGEMNDLVAEDNVKYLWQTPRLTYRGLLYAVPSKLPESINLVKCLQ